MFKMEERNSRKITIKELLHLVFDIITGKDVHLRKIDIDDEIVMIGKQEYSREYLESVIEDWKRHYIIN